MQISRFSKPILFACVLSVGLSAPCSSQKEKVRLFEGQQVVVAAPIALATMHKTGILETNTKFDFEVRGTAESVEIRKGDSDAWVADWRTLGFPPTGQYRVAKIKSVKRPGDQQKVIEVTLNIIPAVDYRIYAPLDQPDAILGIVAPAASADSVLDRGYAALIPSIFIGPLSSFSDAEKLALLRFAHVVAKASGLTHENFKDVTYLSITTPPDGSVWNNLQVSKAERLARLISEQLGTLKAFAKVAVKHDVFGGLKLATTSSYGTAPYYTDQKTDRVEAYFPLEAMIQFANADITSQQLVNKAIILVNGDRVEVNLGAQ